MHDQDEAPPVNKIWKDKENIKFYTEKALEILDRSEHTRMGEWVKDVLVENCKAESEWNDALEFFLLEIKKMGLEVESPVQDMREIASSLFYLRFIMKMIHAAGLGRYEEKILDMEIEKRWKSGLGLPKPTGLGSASPTKSIKKPQKVNRD
jgi:hypothetical protein